MSVSDQKIKEAVALFKEHGGIMRTSEALDEGIHSRTLYWMRDHGYLNRLERGVYQLEDKGPLSNPDLAVVGTKIPDAIVCLISALDFHDMTTEIPHRVHIALPRRHWKPKLDYPPIQVYRFSGKSLTEGIENHEIDGVEIQVYDPAKTIADCFKFRNKIGLEIALEALKRGLKEGKGHLLRYSEVCRYLSG
ncbi:MAG: type IV toxin-antitoxin system AbiEi family antitoxin domain-containing protein [Balneolaceae bacterium]|nr:type IV toxin-antitoxin system AbiEi family antitoxin domain-containing protein [Balneolaceae bacterium]